MRVAHEFYSKGRYGNICIHKCSGRRIPSLSLRQMEYQRLVGKQMTISRPHFPVQQIVKCKGEQISRSNPSNSGSNSPSER